MEELIKITEDKIQDSINEFTKRRSRMFNVVRMFKYPLVGLTAISTIVLGLDLGKEWITNQKNIALIIGAITTGLTTLMTFWNVEEYWIKNKVIELQLLSLQNKFQFEKKVGLNEIRIKEFFRQYQNIIGQQEELWKTTLDEQKESNS
ncbi:SLATT domain-containing protein [Flavobacterium limi]|uniref:DUF4231 domain-containing protein n=1 Tax=Flavobacterium limi TaxID=2045105 RepID=A0ABQ1UR02_9FLAO|nr:SLATT domain-containing protein [Flavobacterium limi]GGF24431.1 hypothetical protein GCM10011518_37200 [Flavobacterium limi]